MPQHSDTSEEQLVILAQEGSEAAFNQLVDRYTSIVYRIAFSMTGVASESEDIVQETFIRVFKHLDRYSSEKASFKTWVLTIARNQSINAYKSLRRSAARIFNSKASEENEGIPEEERYGTNDVTAESLLQRQQEMSRVNKALIKLPKRQRMALTLKAVENLSYAEIGTIMNASESSVESLIFRARKRLTELLDANE
jgi:RNA polymerase sigma-70 factor (ECF subfamily)